MKMQKSYHKWLLSSGVLLILFVAGCASPSQTIPAGPDATTGCSTKDCFISVANDCNEATLTFSEDIGVFKYLSSKDCVFTKTLVSANENETPDMKKLLSGKSLVCTYKKGAFDERWVSSLIFGTEYCEGKLKDILGQLVLFAEQS
ncbi:hypothetical protein HY484_02445 [Candidatus Woesearchaeota archaeon]|nr:hypothetical protein [Candidatus Woesearchaeota archaeon]